MKIGANIQLLVLICITLMAISQYFGIAQIQARFGSGFIVGSPFADEAGEPQSLPVEILPLKKLVERNQIHEFSLSPGFSASTFLFQRALEFAYPARYNQHSKFEFALAREPVEAQCKEIANQDGVNLYACER